MKKTYYVYIVTNYNRTVLYTGITNNLKQRIIEHYLNQNNTKTFTGKYKTFYLIYFEFFNSPIEAITREKEIKGWKRNKKIDLITSENPEIKFLNEEIFDFWPPKEMYH